MGGVKVILSLICVLALLGLAGCGLNDPLPVQSAPPTTVVDTLSNGDEVSLICLRPPRESQKEYAIATDLLESLVLNKSVELQKDVTDRNEEGFLPRYVYVDEFFVNEEIIRQGMASITQVGNDIRLCDSLIPAQNEAILNSTGRWKRKICVTCDVDIYSCNDFDTRAEAQAVLDACDYDVHNLDSDEDGLACDRRGALSDD
jgi:predicted small lipoprotein YifL